MKVLVATQKPFAPVAVEGIRGIVEKAGYEFALLEKYPGEAELAAAAADADALIVRSDKVTAAVLEAAPKLRIVVRAGAGYDNLDLAACSARGVVAMNTPGQNSNAVAELAIAMMIFMARGQFTPSTGSEISGKTLGVQAFGNVGRLVARKAEALGMKVLATDPFLTPEQIREGGAEPVESVEFPKGKKWGAYVDSRRLEITCGEAPYLVNRYDVATGEEIPVEQRSGILDRKLRVVDENAPSEKEWLKWAFRAFEATYGYELQGDNLVIARVNVFMTLALLN